MVSDASSVDAFQTNSVPSQTAAALIKKRGFLGGERGEGCLPHCAKEPRFNTDINSATVGYWKVAPVWQRELRVLTEQESDKGTQKQYV